VAILVVLFPIVCLYIIVFTRHLKKKIRHDPWHWAALFYTYDYRVVCVLVQKASINTLGSVFAGSLRLIQIWCGHTGSLSDRLS